MTIRFDEEGRMLPGSDREPPKFKRDSFPTLASEVRTLSPIGARDRVYFPFLSWAAANQFAYPPDAAGALSLCESAAEAYFVRGFFQIPEADRVGLTLDVQVKLGLLRIDTVVTSDRCKLAIEIDGMTFHARKYDQVAADYLRERRIVCAGYTLIRFTAQEVFKTTPECWRQVLAIIAARPFPPLR